MGPPTLKQVGRFRFQSRMPVCRIQSLAAILGRIRHLRDAVVSAAHPQNRQELAALDRLGAVTGSGIANKWRPVGPPYFFSPVRKTLKGRLIVPVQARVKLLPPSVQVWVPLRSACRRTKAPLYFASYSRLPDFHEPCSSMSCPLRLPFPCSGTGSAASRRRTTWLYRTVSPVIVTSIASRPLPAENGSLSQTRVPR